ncbi:hypothetical protein [Piscinibacter sakaiensis]|uniref:hypothetical protein n=1 Tax=Piscinibacter sakaiensis TaxID=1547922 RepID=UPI001E6359B5|nr:hypothetical protein [Piscinibacter sakaiensis]
MASPPPVASPPPPPPPPPTVACAVNRAAALAYEERRLTTPLPASGANVTTNDETPVATRILVDTGFDGFAPAFAAKLCAAGGTTQVTNLEQAVALVKAEGAALWRAAVDRVQRRRASPAASVLPASDDRMLYWARVAMSKELRQWAPSFALSAAQREQLHWEFERASRGQYDIDFPTGNNPAGKKYRRMIISGFDVFTLGTPGTPNTGLRNGNPSGATALEMDGREFTLPDGSTLHVQAYVLPVSYTPFLRGMQEDTLGPWFLPGPKRIDASITISQGSANRFNLEAFNGRFTGPTSGNDGIVFCPPGADRLPSFRWAIGSVTAPDTDPITDVGAGCNVTPPQRWVGYDAATRWLKDFPPQFIESSNPHAAMTTGNTQSGIVRPPGATSQGTEGFDVLWQTSFSYFPDCNAVDTVNVPTHTVFNAMPDLSTIPRPNPAWCSRNGGGGSYLSNESAYRNTLLRDTFMLDIPAGHIHIPVMNNYHSQAITGQPRNDNAITDSRYEAYRTAIVGQTKNLLVVVGNSLIFK